MPISFVFQASIPFVTVAVVNIEYDGDVLNREPGINSIKIDLLVTYMEEEIMSNAAINSLLQD